MRGFALSVPLFLVLGFAMPVFAEDVQRSDIIAERMAYKLTRGVTNIATSFIELPKQTYVTTRDEGAIGVVIGPLKGVGMTVYRAFIGAVETAFFLVPQPGYYDPMIDPEFVWNGWDNPHADNSMAKETEPSAAVEKKGE